MRIPVQTSNNQFSRLRSNREVRPMRSSSEGNAEKLQRNLLDSDLVRPILILFRHACCRNSGKYGGSWKYIWTCGLRSIEKEIRRLFLNTWLTRFTRSLILARLYTGDSISHEERLFSLILIGAKGTQYPRKVSNMQLINRLEAEHVPAQLAESIPLEPFHATALYSI